MKQVQDKVQKDNLPDAVLVTPPPSWGMIFSFLLDTLRQKPQGSLSLISFVVPVFLSLHLIVQVSVLAARRIFLAGQVHLIVWLLPPC
jgi:hypothetical protein